VSDDYKLPKRRELVDLEGKPVLPDLPNDLSASAIPIADETNLALDRPEPVEEPQKSRGGFFLFGIVGGLALMIALLVYSFWTKAHPSTVTLTITNVAATSQLTLDGKQLSGTTVVVPYDKQQHALVVLTPGQPTKRKPVRADRDATIDMSVPW
jgi:hypothetical protein